MSSEINSKRFDDMYLALNTIANDDVIKAFDLGKELEALFAVNIISLVNYIYPLYGKNNHDELEKYKKIIDNDLYKIYAYRAMKNSLLSRISKIRIRLIYKHFYVYCFIMKTLKK